MESISTLPKKDRLAELKCDVDAFVRGGDPGMFRLNAVWTNILHHYGIDEFDAMDTCGLCRAHWHEDGRLVVKRSDKSNGGKSCSMPLLLL